MYCFMRTAINLSRIWIGLTLLSLVTACGDGKKDIRDYYFPIRDLKEGLVYEYRAVGSERLGPVYWYYRSFFQPGGVFLTGTYYEQSLEPLQLVREEAVSNGMLLAELYLYMQDSTGKAQPLKAEVLAGNSFPFEVKDSSSLFLYKVRFDLPSDSVKHSITVIKNRYYMGDTTVQVMGKTIPCVKFKVKEAIEDEIADQGVLEPETDGYELYAEGLGLVYFEKKLGRQRVAYRLHDRYDMEELVKLLGDGPAGSTE